MIKIINFKCFKITFLVWKYLKCSTLQKITNVANVANNANVAILKDLKLSEALKTVRC